MRTRKLGLTIERIRTLVLATGVLLVISLVVILGVRRWRNRLNLREIPKRLGVNIQQEANGVTYTQARAGHTLFKIHASKVVQLKQGGKALLQDVQIELYGEDGSRVDRIAGKEFEYDQKQGRATAAGPVEITLMRPGDTPAVAGLAERTRGTVLSQAAQTAARGEIHVKTSGLIFDQKSGIASTQDRVDFSIQQGTGSSRGAQLDSDRGLMVLDHDVELHLRRGTQNVDLRAQHAELERGDLLGRMTEAEASFRGGNVQAGRATVLFRSDGTAVRLQAENGVTMTTPHAAHLSAARGSLEFDDHNQPQSGRLEGGTTLQSGDADRKLQASAPAADLEFTPQGILRHAHLQRGVTMHSETVAATGSNGVRPRLVRDWRSPVADLEFRSVQGGRLELASAQGTGGVVITGETQSGGKTTPSRLAADQVTGVMGPGQELSSLDCQGHATLEQVTSAGATQKIASDRLVATMAPPGESATASGNRKSGAAAESMRIQSATATGNVSIVQTPEAQAGGKAAAEMHANARRADYDGKAGSMHLSGDPRVEDGQLQIAADAIDVARESGDTLASGNVKASWLSSEPAGAAGKPGRQEVGLGGQGPAHVIAREAHLRRATGEVTFQGGVRMWQQANSITAPTILLNRQAQTLVAHGDGKANPVRLVLLSAGSNAGSLLPAPDGKARVPAVIRVQGGDLKFSEAEHKAVIVGGPAGDVEAQTGGALSRSDSVELLLLPAHNHAAADGGSAQVDRVIASGDVHVSSQGRSGYGDRLVYLSREGEYVLTGTAASPPRMTDPVRGMVTGNSLIFNSRDGSVSIEGDGQKTSTQTSAPR